MKKPIEHAATPPYRPAWRSAIRAGAPACLLLAAAAVLMISCDGNSARDPAVVFLPGTRELSGITYHPERGTLFAVGDEGDVFELSTGGTLLNHAALPGAPDLEGITYCGPARCLYAVEEGKDRILEIDPASLSVLRTIDVPRTCNGEIVLMRQGDGLEGIAWLPPENAGEAGSFLVANQGSRSAEKDPPALVEIAIPAPGRSTASIVRWTRMPVLEISDLYFDETNRQLYVLSDRSDSLLICTRDGAILSRIPLPGSGQEGITRDAGGNVYIAQDTGGILKLNLLPAAR